jgi:hypothetical protein
MRWEPIFYVNADIGFSDILHLPNIDRVIDNKQAGKRSHLFIRSLLDPDPGRVPAAIDDAAG